MERDPQGLEPHCLERPLQHGGPVVRDPPEGEAVKDHVAT
jgi:hypothetical protein